MAYKYRNCVFLVQVWDFGILCEPSLTLPLVAWVRNQRPCWFFKIILKVTFVGNSELLAEEDQAGVSTVRGSKFVQSKPCPFSKICHGLIWWCSCGCPLDFLKPAPHGWPWDKALEMFLLTTVLLATSFTHSKPFWFFTRLHFMGWQTPPITTVSLQSFPNGVRFHQPIQVRQVRRYYRISWPHPKTNAHLILISQGTRSSFIWRTLQGMPK